MSLLVKGNYANRLLKNVFSSRKKYYKSINNRKRKVSM